MAREWVLLAALLVALAQKCESDIFELEHKKLPFAYEPSQLSQLLLNALKRLRIDSKTKPDKLVAKIHKAANGKNADDRRMLRGLSSVIEEKKARCPYELFDLIESFIELRLEPAHGNDGWIVGPINRFLKEKIAPKLDKCVENVVNTYAKRKELDALEPLDGFFEAAYGPNWDAKISEFEFSFDYGDVDVKSAIDFIQKTDVAGFNERRNPAYKIEEFLDEKCERLQAFRDVAVIQLVNAIHCDAFPHSTPPPEAKTGLPKNLLKVKNYYRLCAEWTYSNYEWTDRFIEYMAYKYNQMQGGCISLLHFMDCI
jgi:hypothetical protein